MSRRLKFVVLLVIVLCCACYVAELFDSWDSPLPSDSELEFGIVRLLMCFGAAVSIAQLVRWLRSHAEAGFVTLVSQPRAPIAREFVAASSEFTSGALPLRI